MKLLKPVTIGDLVLKNRIFMAPLTRNRAGRGRVPQEINRIYYNQRSSAGLIISEATVITEQAAGYIDTPGIYTQDQISGWRRITNSVKKYNSHMFCQLWHTGRCSHSDFHNGELPVSSSASNNPGKIRTPLGKKDKQTPRALTKDEISRTVEDYAKAAENAIKADFDGVEIHGANGYLIDQFICDGTNQRTDDYGGSIENRLRFPLEVVNAIIDRIGSHKVGIRLSPNGTFNNMLDSDPKTTFSTMISKLNELDLAYLHLTEHYNPPGSNYPIPDHYLKHGEVIPFYSKFYRGSLIVANGFDKNSAENIIKKGQADAVAFGKLFISNPDLPLRFENDAPLNEWDVTTFYGGNEKGYIDYPFLRPASSK